MRKKIFIAAAIIIFLLLSFLGWLQYRQYSSWNIPVHKDIQTVARINTDDLIRHFITEYGINFSKKMKKGEKKTSDSSKNTGIYFPGNIFIYTIATRQPTTFFCSLPVYDLEDFKAHLKSSFNIQLYDSAGVSRGTSTNGKITVVCNKHYISFAYSKEKEEVESILTEILRDKNILSKHHLLTEQLKKEKTIIAVTGGLFDFTVDLADKNLFIKASSKESGKINILSSPKLVVGNDLSLSSLSANIFPQATLFKEQYAVKQYSIATDSILQYYGGKVHMEIGPAITQMDTVTTYEYDDNFEKVEKQTLNEVKVPDIHLSLLMKPGIVPYMQKQNFITSEMKLNKEVFPLYNVAVNMDNGMLHFKTRDLKNSRPAKLIASDNFLELNMDAKRTIEALEIPSLQQYISNIHSLKVTGHKEQDKIVINASLQFEHAAIKDIVAILKNL